MRRVLSLPTLIAALALALPGCGPDNNPVVLIDTSMGPIKVELYESKAPITVKNFLQYVDDKHYDGTIFHRVIANFMIQGGGFGTNNKEKLTRDPIKNESFNGLSNKRGTIAMARTPKADSATAQFYINVKDNTNLDYGTNPQDKAGYCVFGKVLEGMDVVDEISRVQTEAGDVPTVPVVIKSVRKL
jgi:peptidyl-prolyl cis-trans isomerase B (cyclophilin B)